MANGSNGHDPSRLDRLEGLVEVLVNRHIEFEDEHKRLLTAQVVLTDRLDRLTVQVGELRESQKQTDKQLQQTDKQLQQTDKQLQQTDKQMQQTDKQLRQTDERLNALIEVVGLVRKRLE